MNCFRRTTPITRAQSKLAESKILLQQHRENAEYHSAMVRMLETRVARLAKELNGEVE